MRRGHTFAIHNKYYNIFSYQSFDNSDQNPYPVTAVTFSLLYHADLILSIKFPKDVLPVTKYVTARINPLKNPADCAIMNMIIDNQEKFNIKRGQQYETWNGRAAERRQKHPF